jgi:hypothetical protein
MLNHSIGAALAAGVVALFLGAPIASADDPPACAPDDQQCQEQQTQQQGAGIANQVIDNVQQGMDQAKQVQNAIDPSTGKPYPGRPFHLLLNGAEVCWPVGVPISALDHIEPFPGDSDGSC